jgi:translocation and assembly module TamB
MRRRILLVFVILVVTVLGLAATVFFTTTRTQWGRDQVVAFITRTLNDGVNGRVHIGRLGGNLVTGLTLDTLELRDRNDSLFIALSGLRLTYDPRDLFDQRILVRNLYVASVTANIFEDTVGMFNFRRIFESDAPPSPLSPVTNRRPWGHFIKVENAVVDSLRFTLTTRWRPSDLLSGRERDSVVAFNLQREDKEIWRGPGVYYETKRWTNGHIELDSARIDDRQPGGRTFAIRTLSVDETDPPFRFRNASGNVRIQGDSIWADVPHFELPGSAGDMKGKIWWGAGQPTRFDLAIHADTVSLADVAWVYPTLPTEGGGRIDLLIRSQEDPRIIDYVLSNMDVRTTDSRLRGAMTFGVGAPIPILKDVDIQAQPIDFRLIETLAGEPLPYPWRGTITGTLLASGGPLNDWMVDESDLVFRDANVPGATTIGRGRGRINILEPSEVVFSGFDVNLDQLDLRTLQYLVPAFPRLNGHVAGRATLDSLWTDVRFREADLSHTDGSGPATRVVGAGRVTFEETQTIYDVALLAQPFSFTTFRRAYAENDVPLKGEYVGPLRLFGTTADLAVTTQLRGPAGQLAYDGRVDGDSIGGYGLDGTFSFQGLDLKTLLDTAVTPTTDLWGRAEMNVTFDSLLTLAGTTTIEFDRNSRVDSVTVYAGARARMRFADGVVHFAEGDTVRSVAGDFVVAGGLGLGAGHRDSLQIGFRLDSLGGWRRYMSGVSEPDTVTGSLAGQLTLRGSIDTLGVEGWVEGDSLRIPGLTVQRLRVTPELSDVTGAFGGQIIVGAETASLAGIAFSRIDGTLGLSDGRAGEYGVLARASNGSVLESGGTLAFAGDTTSVRIDQLSIMVDANRFELDRPATIRVEPALVAVDSMVLEGRGDSRLSFAASAPDTADISAGIAINAMPLADLSQILQTGLGFTGEVSGNIDIRGTRESPVMTGTAALEEVSTGEFSLARVSLNASYADRRVRAIGQIVQEDTLVLTVDANWPVDLALVPRDTRAMDDTVRVTVRSPDVDLSILESFTPAIRSASGIGRANLELAGQRRDARLNGGFTIRDGRATLPGMGITVRAVHADILARNDTVLVDSLYLVSGAENDDDLSITGWIARPLVEDSVSFDLAVRAREFHAIGLERQLADLTIDADVTWRGTDLNSRAAGVIVVQRGAIALPEDTDKDLFPIENLAELGVDSSAIGRLGLIPPQASRFIAGLTPALRVAMGPDVWLRSEDAAIKLTGQVDVTVVNTRDFGSATTRSELALVGELQTERGTYRLNVSPLQRTFLVQSGRLIFDRRAGFDPILDIRATYTSRQIETTYGGRNDVRIGAHITGSLSNPSGYLYSADSLAFLSESDLLSYVLFDQPSFNVGGGLRGNTNTAVALLLGTASSWASSYASRYAGGFVDFVQLQTTSEGQLFGSNLGIGGAFEGAQLGVGKQLSDRLFLSATSGLCQVGQVFRQSSAAAPSILSSIGAKVEYRFGRSSPSGVSGAYEPSFDKLVCNGVIDIGFTTSKKQVGFDFFRVWRR